MTWLGQMMKDVGVQTGASVLTLEWASELQEGLLNTDDR